MITDAYALIAQVTGPYCAELGLSGAIWNSAYALRSRAGGPLGGRHRGHSHCAATNNARRLEEAFSGLRNDEQRMLIHLLAKWRMTLLAQVNAPLPGAEVLAGPNTPLARPG
jgi:hypothetical protein